MKLDQFRGLLRVVPFPVSPSELFFFVFSLDCREAFAEEAAVDIHFSRIGKYPFFPQQVGQSKFEVADLFHRTKPCLPGSWCNCGKHEAEQKSFHDREGPLAWCNLPNVSYDLFEYT
jgi:hypothetical protein